MYHLNYYIWLTKSHAEGARYQFLGGKMSLQMDLVSIIMPSYNTGAYIADTIKSVLAQTYTNWELIIVDDCSSDSSMDVIDALCHPERSDTSDVSSRAQSRDLAKIRVFQNDRNSGAAVSRNRALREAKGRYIAFLDSDDLWAPDKLEKQIAFMKANNYAFTYTRYNEIDENGAKTGVLVSGPKHVGKIGMYNYCWPGCLTVMYDREVVGEVKIADIKKNNDYAMWLKVIRKADCHLLDETLASYRKRSGSISHVCHSERSEAKSKNLARHFALIKWHYKLYREAEGMNPLRSAWITLRNLAFGTWKKIKYVGKAA